MGTSTAWTACAFVALLVIAELTSDYWGITLPLDPRLPLSRRRTG
ncbi:MAG: hypothetical protein U1F67_04290 [Rubrivivax sp.]